MPTTPETPAQHAARVRHTWDQRLAEGWIPVPQRRLWVHPDPDQPDQVMIPGHQQLAREAEAYQTTEKLVEASRQALAGAVRSAQAWPDDMLIAMRSAADLLADGCEPQPELARELHDHAAAVEALAAQPPAQPVPERDPLWLRAAMAGIRGTDWALRRLANRSRR